MPEWKNAKSVEEDWGIKVRMNCEEKSLTSKTRKNV